MKKLFENWNIIIFILSLFAISFALTAEYIFNLLPCSMCMNQRYPYYFIIIIFILFYFFKKKSSIIFYILSEIAILYGLFYSIWHVGVEQKIFNGPSGCASQLIATDSINDLKEKIINQDLISCAEPNWIILGFSAATINTFLLLLFLLFNSIYIYRRYYE